MVHDLRPTTDDDLPALSRFLTDGFGTPASAPFAAPDVLRWKYLDHGDPRSFLAVAAGTKTIVGHVGISLSRFDRAVSTLHMTDWLSSAAGKGVGVSLMRGVHALTETQYSLGASDAARAVMSRAGYDLIARVPVYQKVLRVGYRLKDPAHSASGRLLRAMKDTAGTIGRRSRRPRVEIELRPIEAFGPEIEPILEAYQARAIFTDRGAGPLNHRLGYPRGGISGWLILRGGVVRGLGVLSVTTRAGGIQAGQIADCLLDDSDDDAWHAATFALTAALRHQGADIAIGYASNDWTTRAFLGSGYATTHSLEFRLRDRSHCLPRNRPFHLTPLEADYAYT